MPNAWDINAKALIAFALVMIVCLLTYIAFYKDSPKKWFSRQEKSHPFLLQMAKAWSPCFSLGIDGKILVSIFMANTRSTKKNIRVSRRRAVKNLFWKKKVHDLVKKARREKLTADLTKSLQSTLDKAAKKGIIHKNKAARLKSRLTVVQPAHAKR